MEQTNFFAPLKRYHLVTLEQNVFLCIKAYNGDYVLELQYKYRVFHSSWNFWNARFKANKFSN